MTYPPQPPPGPYGPPPPDPYQQGPNPYQQNPYQQPPWAAGPQGGFPMAPPPKKPRTGLITTLIIVAILVIGGGAVGAYFLLNKDDHETSGKDAGGSARSAANTYVTALQKVLNTPLKDVDVTPLKPVTCGGDFTKMTDEVRDAKDFGESDTAAPPTQDEVRITIEKFEQTSDGADFTMTRRVSGEQHTESKDMTVAKEGGDWKVCGLYKSSSKPGGGQPGGDQPGGGTPPTGGEEQPSKGEIPPNPIPTHP
jgi:hypothetical protein